MSPTEMVAAFQEAMAAMVASRKSLGLTTDLADQGVRDDIANNLAIVVEGALDEVREALGGTLGGGK